MRELSSRAQVVTSAERDVRLGHTVRVVGGSCVGIEGVEGEVGAGVTEVFSPLITL